MPVTSVLRKKNQEDPEFRVILGNIRSLKQAWERNVNDPEVAHVFLCYTVKRRKFYS